MARRPTANEPKPAKLSIEEMRIAIPRLELRIRDFEAFDPSTLKSRDDPRLTSIENKMRETLAAVFGRDSYEYGLYEHRLASLDSAGISIGHVTPMSEVIEAVTSSAANALQTLRDLKAHFEEEIGLAAPSARDRAIRAYTDLDLHPEIARAANHLYMDGHYSNAVEDAVKALNEFVRYRSGVSDKDGATLMQHVFNKDKPILKFNQLADQSDKDEQQGFMMLFWGSVSGLRNPRAHKIIKDDPERALEFIAMVSLLAKLVDEAKR